MKIRIGSLWLKQVSAFATVTLIILAVSAVAFYLISQEEFARFLDRNSSSVQGIVLQAQEVGILQSPISTSDPDSDIIEITVPLEAAIQESTVSSGSQFLNSLQRTALYLVIFAAALTLAAGTLLSRQITRPLVNLKSATLQIGSGEMGVRVPVTTNDEVGQVGQAFNQMADRLEDQERLRRQIVADVAHELRTPLSVIQGNLEAMIDGLLPAGSGELKEVHGEVLRLIRLTDDLRLLSLADARQLLLEQSLVDMGGVIESILRQMTPSASERGIHLEGDIEGINTPITADKDKLKQALINLVDNSLRYTPPGGKVEILTTQTSDSIEITVVDDGPGIPIEDQPYVFDRFWRGDHSRSRAAGGSGLGLAISKEIIQLHGGSLSIASPQTGGTKFIISLPLNNQQLTDQV